MEGIKVLHTKHKWTDIDKNAITLYLREKLRGLEVRSV